MQGDMLRVTYREVSKMRQCLEKSAEAKKDVPSRRVRAVRVGTLRAQIGW